MRGPIDYILVKFKDAKFEGKIIEELEKAAAAGTVSVLAITAINKDADGAVSTVDITTETAAFNAIAPLKNSLIDTEDVQEVGDLLEPGTGAGLLIVEQLWAKDLKQAILDTGGSLVAEGRIHPDAAIELEAAA